MTIPTLIYVLVTQHLIGDWWLQGWSPQMAIKKSTSNLWLTAHVGIVAVTLWVFVGVWNVVEGGPGLLAVAIYVAINAVAHWGTDYVTSRINTRNWYVHAFLHTLPDNRPCASLDVDDVKRFWFWGGIGTDQWVHIVCLFATADWLLL